MKQSSPPAARNSAPITAVLREWLPHAGLVLEVASGTGEHAVAFARFFTALDWQPSDLDPSALRSVAAWREEADLPNLHAPITIDVTKSGWTITKADAILAINMVHISGWPAALGLLNGSARLLPEGGPLILYGPWRVDGEPLAPSNREFDASLRHRNPEWGLREVGAFASEAAARGFELVEQRTMPANNRMLLFRRE